MNLATAENRSHTFDLMYELLRKELRIRYKKLALGYLWSLISPLIYATLYFVVFSRILNVKTANYPLFLISSLFPWQWMTNSILVAPQTFVSNTALIKKTLFPRHLIPVVVVFQDALHFFASIPVILVFVFIFKGTPSIHWLYGIPLLGLMQYGIALGINLTVATLTVFFRDIERILQIGMTFLFYMTPVLYSESMIPDRFKSLICFHPLAPLMINWRNLFIEGRIDWNYAASSMTWCALFLVVSRWVYSKLSWRFAEVL
jgi:lipopolysaccharide transport system permease protein